MGFEKGNVWGSKRKNTKHSKETIEKIRISHFGKRNSPKSEFKKGHIPWNKGTKGLVKPWNTGKKIPQISGANHYLWIKDRNELMEKHRLRSTKEWKNWRKSIFERDNYTCQECEVRGGYLEPHHIIPIRLNKNEIFNIRNGITLCRQCHKKTIWKESNFTEKYSALVAAH